MFSSIMRRRKNYISHNVVKLEIVSMKTIKGGNVLWQIYMNRLFCRLVI